MGVVVALDARVAQMVVGERQEGCIRINVVPQMLQPLIQIDVGIEQLAHAAALPLHPAKPFRIGHAYVTIYHP